LNDLGRHGGNLMLIQRLHSRSKIDSYCLLKDRNGDTYEAFLGDISQTGALVKLDGNTRLHIGDLCDLMLHDKSATFPVKRAVKVVRLDTYKIGVRFLT
jgi:hypothetical protein